MMDTYKMQVGEYDKNGNIKQLCLFGKVSDPPCPGLA